jgi:tRNA nucleotidyltransferase/poly(A) polymerase
MTIDGKIFEVGGCVRDEMLGVSSNDIDFTFVPDSSLSGVSEGWMEMKGYLIDKGYKIFLETEDCFTIRAKFPSDHVNRGLVADFVMARKEVGYDSESRKPKLELGTLTDDLIRRDFTVNAMAKDMEGNIIDLFEGKKHLRQKILFTPVDTEKTFLDDPLRLIRALRFSITKGFKMSQPIWDSLLDDVMLDRLESVVSTERIREELTKAFKHDTLSTLELLQKINKINPRIQKICFKDGIWLMPTTKK